MSVITAVMERFTLHVFNVINHDVKLRETVFTSTLQPGELFSLPASDPLFLRPYELFFHALTQGTMQIYLNLDKVYPSGKMSSIVDVTTR